MKKVTLMLAALALVLGISQCKKQGTPQQAGEKQYIELTADNGNNGSKVDVDFATIPSVMNLTWEEGDVITVSGGATGTLTLDRGVGTSQGHFSGEITTGSGDVVFTYKKAAQQNRGSDDPDFNNQDGTEEWIKANLVLQATSEYHDNGKYSLTMEMPYAVLKLNLSELVGTKNDVTISAGNGAVATVKNLTKANSEEVYMAVPEVGEHTYTFSGNDASAKKPWTLEANTYYTADTEGAAIVIEPSIPEGALKGLFTVGVDAEGNPRKVYFSKGNLQAKYNGSSYDWSFAEHQSDYIGNASGNNTINDDCSNIDGAIVDMFGWSTGSTNFGISKSKEASAYSGDFVDWGVALRNGNGVTSTNTWRTLTKDEWSYLVRTRKVNGKTGYGETCVKATIDGIKGLIIFHDSYTGEISGLTSIPEGCVFLPAAGRRYGIDDFYGVGNYTFYWSATPDGTGNTSQVFYFYTETDNEKPTCNIDHRYGGYSVRLVCNVNN